MQLLVFVLAASHVTVALFVIGGKAERSRATAVQREGAVIGFGFEAERSLHQIRALGDVPLFSRSRYGGRVTNLLAGRIDNDETRVFDYDDTTGAGRWDMWRRKQTVALYPGGARDLPDLALSAKKLLHRVLGYGDIEFETSPVFSSHYLLTGPYPAAIRSVFNPGTLQFFERQSGWTVEVQDGTVAIYRNGKRIRPSETAGFLRRTHRVLQALRQSQAADPRGE